MTARSARTSFTLLLALAAPAGLWAAAATAATKTAVPKAVVAAAASASRPTAAKGSTPKVPAAATQPTTKPASKPATRPSTRTAAVAIAATKPATASAADTTPPAKTPTAGPLPTPPGKIKDAYDVVIAGAGTGGVGAALQAARLGASVLLLEQTDWVGGQALAAGVTSMDEAGPLVRERGIYREFADRVYAHYKPLNKSVATCYGPDSLCVEPHVGQQILYDMLAAPAGVGPSTRPATSPRVTGPAVGSIDLSLRSTVTKALVNGNTVLGAEVAIVGPAGAKSKAVRSHVLIDATEWGDVIPLTGARYRVGNSTSDKVDPARKIQDGTWAAVVRQYPNGVPPQYQVKSPPPGYTSNVEAAFRRSLSPDAEEKKVQGEPASWNWFVRYRGMPDSTTKGNPSIPTRTHLNFNNDYPLTVAAVEDPAIRWTAEKAMRVKTLDLLYYIQTSMGKADWSVADDEGYDTPYNRALVERQVAEQPELAPFRAILRQFPVMAYVREGRRIVGVHTLTSAEVNRKKGSAARRFPTVLAIGDYPVDLHGAKKAEDLELNLEPIDNAPKAFGEFGRGPFGVPFECFIPESVDGFLPAEKNLSQTRLANGATRLQPSTMLTGQAAGAIAALSVRHHVHPRQLDPALVQQALLDGRDTLFLSALEDVPRESPDWPAVQLILARQIASANQGMFWPNKPVMPEHLRTMLRRALADPPPPGDAKNGRPAEAPQAAAAAEAAVLAAGSPVTRAGFAAVLTAGAAAAPTPFAYAAPELADPAQPITRAEAARLLAAMLEQRGLARATAAAIPDK